MDLLEQMVSLMDRKDVKHFRIFSARAVDDADRKDLKLFTLLRKASNSYSDVNAFEMIYDGDDKNAFYRLKNRLATDIGKSIFLQNHSINNEMQCAYFLALGNYYQYDKKHHKLAQHFYIKAEKKAKEIEYYTLLDVVYTHIIRLLVEEGALNPENYIRKRKENSLILGKLREVDDILQILEYRMKISQGLAGSSLQQIDMLKKLSDQYSKDEEVKNSARLQYGLYQIIRGMLLQRKDYEALEEYLIQTFEDYQLRKLFDKSYQRQKLQMIAWIANAAFMNKSFHKSLEYAEKLRLEMENYDKLFYNEFVFFYYNILIINYSAINPDKAINILLELSKKEKLKELKFNSIFIHYNLALLYFQKKQYSAAIQALNRLYHSEEFRLADPLLKLKAHLGELILRYELNEFDFLEYRTKQVQKENKEVLDSENAAKEAQFLNLFSQIADKPKIINHKDFKAEIEDYLNEWAEEFEVDDALFKLNVWLAEKAKIAF